MSETPMAGLLEALLGTRERPPRMLETSMAHPWEALWETQEHPPPMSKNKQVKQVHHKHQDSYLNQNKHV
jgi:hypothetical protein